MLGKVACTIILFLSSTGILFYCWIASAADRASTETVAVSEKSLKTPTDEEISKSYGRIEMGFEANEGQTDHSVNFLARGAGYTLFLEPDEGVLALSGNQRNDEGFEEATKRFGSDLPGVDDA